MSSTVAQMKPVPKLVEALLDARRDIVEFHGDDNEGWAEWAGGPPYRTAGEQLQRYFCCWRTIYGEVWHVCVQWRLNEYRRDLQGWEQAKHEAAQALARGAMRRHDDRDPRSD